MLSLTLVAPICVFVDSLKNIDILEKKAKKEKKYSLMGVVVVIGDTSVFVLKKWVSDW